MRRERSPRRYQEAYRAKEMEILANWVLSGVSGSVVGMGGAGKSNLMRFLCDSPTALASYLPHESEHVIVIEVDLNNLPSNDLATLYRVILRSFYERRARFESEIQIVITQLYRENRASLDPFLSQSALRELLLHVEEQDIQVVLVLDRFDKFYETVTPELTDTLRGLRDRFKRTLSYIVGMRQEVVYLDNPQLLGELYEILDTHVCWVGPMNEADARQMINEETSSDYEEVGESDVQCLLRLTGGYPALLKAACHCWLTTLKHLPNSEWLDLLLEKQSIQYRLSEIWAGLTQEEQLALSELQKWPTTEDCVGKNGVWSRKKAQKVYDEVNKLVKPHRHALERLQMKGLCHREEIEWHLFGDLFTAYIENNDEQGRGKIWLDRKSKILYQGQIALNDLAPKERDLLLFFTKHPLARHSHKDLMQKGWSEVENLEGVTTESLYKVISDLRQKIEPNRSKPSYIVTLRGGYQFFPEGRPGK